MCFYWKSIKISGYWCCEGCQLYLLDIKVSKLISNKKIQKMLLFNVAILLCYNIFCYKMTHSSNILQSNDKVRICNIFFGFLGNIKLASNSHLWYVSGVLR